MMTWRGCQGLGETDIAVGRKPVGRMLETIAEPAHCIAKREMVRNPREDSRTEPDIQRVNQPKPAQDEVAP